MPPESIESISVGDLQYARKLSHNSRYHANEALRPGEQQLGEDFEKAEEAARKSPQVQPLQTELDALYKQRGEFYTGSSMSPGLSKLADPGNQEKHDAIQSKINEKENELGNVLCKDEGVCKAARALLAKREEGNLASSRFAEERKSRLEPYYPGAKKEKTSENDKAISPEEEGLLKELARKEWTAMVKARGEVPLPKGDVYAGKTWRALVEQEQALKASENEIMASNKSREAKDRELLEKENERQNILAAIKRVEKLVDAAVDNDAQVIEARKKLNNFLDREGPIKENPDLSASRLQERMREPLPSTTGGVFVNSLTPSATPRPTYVLNGVKTLEEAEKKLRENLQVFAKENGINEEQFRLDVDKSANIIRIQFPSDDLANKFEGNLLNQKLIAPISAQQTFGTTPTPKPLSKLPKEDQALLNQLRKENTDVESKIEDAKKALLKDAKPGATFNDLLKDAENTRAQAEETLSKALKEYNDAVAAANTNTDPGDRQQTLLLDRLKREALERLLNQLARYEAAEAQYNELRGASDLQQTTQSAPTTPTPEPQPQVAVKDQETNTARPLYTLKEGITVKAIEKEFEDFAKKFAKENNLDEKDFTFKFDNKTNTITVTFPTQKAANKFTDSLLAKNFINPLPRSSAVDTAANEARSKPTLQPTKPKEEEQQTLNTRPGMRPTPPASGG